MRFSVLCLSCLSFPCIAGNGVFSSLYWLLRRVASHPSWYTNKNKNTSVANEYVYVTHLVVDAMVLKFQEHLRVPEVAPHILLCSHVISCKGIYHVTRRMCNTEHICPTVNMTMVMVIAKEFDMFINALNGLSQKVFLVFSRRRDCPIIYRKSVDSSVN